MGNEQSQMQQNDDGQAFQQMQPQQKHLKQQNMQDNNLSGEMSPNNQQSYQSELDQGQTIQKPIDSQASFRQNPMSESQQNNQQQILSYEQTAHFGNLSNPNTNFNSTAQQQPIRSFRDQQGQYQQQQQPQSSYSLQKNSQQHLQDDQQMPMQDQEQYSQQQLEQIQQQQMQDQYNQMGQQNPHLESFQQNEQGEYMDPNANKYSAIDQERKNQIIQEQLLYAQSQPINQEKKLTKQQEQELIYNLQQKGKDIEYRQRILNERFAQESVEECLFQPSQNVKQFTGKNSNSQQSQVIGLSLAQQQEPRSFQQFLNDQNKFLNKREKGIKEIKNRVEEKQQEGFTGKPQLCQKSEAMVQNKIDQNKRMNSANKQPTYQRLYELNDKNKKNKKQNDENQKIEKSQQFATKQNSVQQAIKNNRTKEEAANRLYQDFKRRQDKQKEQQQYFSKKQPSQKEDTQILSQKKNDLCLAKKLLKEFDQGIAQLQSEYNKNLQYLDYLQMSELLQFMNFTSKHIRIESANFIKERSLINDLWIILEGQKTEKITGRNLILVMLGIMGIHIDIPIFKPQENDQNPPVQQFGEIQLQSPKEETKPNPQQVDSAMPLNRDSDLHEEQQMIQFQNEQAQQQIEQQKYEQQYQDMNQLDQSHSSNKNNENQYQIQSNAKQSQLMSDYKPVDLEEQQKKYNSDQPKQMEDFFNHRYQQLILGTYDQDRNLYLNEEDIKKIQKHFHILYLNRLNFVGSKQDKDNQQEAIKQQQQSISKMPNQTGSQYSITSQKNEQLAYNYRQKLYEVAQQNGQGEQLSNYDLLLAHKDIRERKAHMLREIKEDKEMEECTFAPKTQNYVSPNKDPQSLTSSYQRQQNDIPTFQNVKKPMTTQSLGAERYLSLYKLAKPRSQLRDKATDEIDYEKNCDECTFNPDLQNTKSPQGQNINKPQPYNYIKNGDKQVNRLRTAYNTNSSIKKFKSRGYDYFTSDQKKSGSQMSSKRLQQGSSQYKNNNNYLQQQNLQNQLGNQDMQNDQYQDNLQNQDQQYQQNFDNQQEQQNQFNQEHTNYNNNPQNNDDDNNYEYQNQDDQNQNINQEQNQDQNNSNNQGQQFNNNSDNEDEAPMLFVDVNLSPERIERIVVKKGDDIQLIADQFIQKHQLNPNIKSKLVELLNDQIMQFLDLQLEQQQQKQE